MHRNLTPCRLNKFLKWLSAAVLLATAPALLAQGTDLSSYQGPGILSNGVGNIGNRRGEQVDLRYFAGVSAIMDTNLAPFLRDAQGNLVRIHNLYGIEVNAGAYGVHSWKTSQLAVDYLGSYHRYANSSSYDGTEQTFSLGYTRQLSRRLAFDLRESAGTISMGNSQVADVASADPGAAFNPGSLLFDARTTFLQSSAFATYTQSPRTSYTIGGSAFLQDRKSQGLSNSWGYNLSGKAIRRVTKSTSVGATYTYFHFEFPGFVSRSDSHAFQGVYATTFQRYWTFSLEAGVTVTDVESTFTLALNPVLAALFGQATITGISSGHTIYPSGSATLKRRFQNAMFAIQYVRGVDTGNGAYSTSRRETALVSLNYSGVRKLNMGLDAGYYGGSAIGEAVGKYHEYSAAAGFSYNLGRSIHLSARYDFRNQRIDTGGYRHSSSRATLGFVYSPGSVPLALW